MRVRAAAMQVGHALFGGSNQSLAEAGVNIARLTAGQDPDAIDASRPEYVFGASDALTVAAHAFGEGIPDQTTVDFLAKSDNARLLAKIASRTSISLYEVIEEVSFTDDTATPQERLDRLLALILIEPAVPTDEALGKAWRISDWGKQTYLRMLPEISEAAGVEPTIHGIRGILSPRD
jgi:hypothetical protein